MSDSAMSITIVPQSIKRLVGLKVCPNEQQLAAYVEQQLIGIERSNVEQHLTSCDDCLRQVSFLMHAESNPQEHAPESLVHTAMKFGANRARVASTSWQWLTVATGAAAALALTFVVMERRAPVPVTPDPSKSLTGALSSGAEEHTTTSSSPAAGDNLRGAQEAPGTILIFPVTDEKVDASHLEFRWNAKNGTEYYEIELVSESGDVIWTGRTTASALTLPSHIHLETAKSYYVWLRLHTARGTVEQSRAVRFTIG
jgi:hypothetical protein